MVKTSLVLVLISIFTLPLFAESVDTAWVRRYNGPGNSNDNARAIAVDGSGNVYVTGYSMDTMTSWDYATIKYYPNGDNAWVRIYNGTADTADWARAIAVDGSGNVYVTGLSYGSGTGEDYTTIKYYPNGDTAWVRRYNGPGNAGDDAHAIAVDGSGNVYVTGESFGSGSNYDYATIKYNSNGGTVWVRTYNGPGNGSDEASAIAVDSSGNVYVTGNSYGGGISQDDYATIKYYSNGDTAWVRRYNGPDRDDYANAIAVDVSGNVYVTGTSYVSMARSIYITIKYDLNGNQLWLRGYFGSGLDYDEAYAIAVDNSGNAYVTGRSYNTGTAFDYATIKYGSNGDQLWVRSYNGPGNGGDGSNAIAVDGSGNVYVTGGSWGSGTSSDYATVKYYSNGDTSWVRRYNGPGNGSDGATAIAMDVTGNVYITGTSWGSGTGNDYATIKYVLYRTDTLSVFAYSPVDLIVTDPNLDSIGVSFNTIGNGSYYDEITDLNGDGESDDNVVIPKPLIGPYSVRVIREEGVPDTAHYTTGVKLDGNEAPERTYSVPQPGQPDTCTYSVTENLQGDANGDGKKTVSDVVFLINYLFKGGPEPDPKELGDANCDGKVTVSDVIYMINYLFKGGNPPCIPGSC